MLVYRRQGFVIARFPESGATRRSLASNKHTNIIEMFRSLKPRMKVEEVNDTEGRSPHMRIGIFVSECYDGNNQGLLLSIQNRRRD